MQIMAKANRISICQPGRASCALCCGSHNYMARIGDIESLFTRRASICGGAFQGNDMAISACGPDVPKVIDDAIQCCFVGYIDAERKKIGCLLYAGEGRPDRRFENLKSGLCEHFSCLAREVLDEDEIGFAAELMGDWFYYGLLINDINLLRETKRNYKSPGDVPAEKLSAIKKILLEVAGLKSVHDSDSPDSAISN
jgi:hypothetical protein